MLDEKEIAAEIARLEYVESSYSNYSKLADLYVIKNQMEHIPAATMNPDTGYSYAPPSDQTVGVYGDSEFMQAVAGRSTSDVFKIMDDLMDTLKVVNHRAYISVLRKINEL